MTDLSHAIDCDVHPTVPNLKGLDPYLDPYWRESFIERGIESRAPLREAVELFDVLGATRWSDRARQELRATGETLGPRRPDARDQLTAQELQIAQLAARLFLSHRTIGSHLYRTFPKLGITSRTQLRDALPRAADT